MVERRRRCYERLTGSMQPAGASRTALSDLTGKGTAAHCTVPIRSAVIRTP